MCDYSDVTRQMMTALLNTFKPVMNYMSSYVPSPKNRTGRKMSLFHTGSP